MAILRKEHEHKREKRKLSTKTKIAAVIAFVVIVLALYYVVFLTVSQTVVKTPAVANITRTGTIFSVDSQQYLISLAGVSQSNGKAYIHVSRLPIFVNPLLNVTLTLNNITKINAGTTYANMGIELQSMGGNSITVKVSPLFTSLQIAPDSQNIRSVNPYLYNSGQPAIQTSAYNSGNTTTVSISSTTTSTTTTAAPIDMTGANINATLKSDYMYSLLLNFSTLYANTSRCTPSLYSSLYQSVYHSAPTGPNTYDNVSTLVPYNISISIGGAGNGNYNVAFITKAVQSFYNNKVAATIVVNPDSKLVVSENISSTGIFAGQSITQIGQDYIRAASEGVCGVYV
jgi:hypothetical protein